MAQPDGQRKSDKIIEENLRRVFNEAPDPEMPDRFRTLLDALREQDRSGDRDG